MKPGNPMREGGKKGVREGVKVGREGGGRDGW